VLEELASKQGRDTLRMRRSLCQSLSARPRAYDAAISKLVQSTTHPKPGLSRFWREV